MSRRKVTGVRFGKLLYRISYSFLTRLRLYLICFCRASFLMNSMVFRWFRTSVNEWTMLESTIPGFGSSAWRSSAWVRTMPSSAHSW